MNTPLDRLIVWHRMLPSDSHFSAQSEWASVVATAFEDAGGQLLATLGGSVAYVFDVPDGHQAMEGALRLLHEADTQELQISIGVAMGSVSKMLDGWRGAVIDRAQLLAHRGRPGELVVDARTRQASASYFLFQRTVGSGARALRGHSVDRSQLSRNQCGQFLEKLHEPSIPKAIEDALIPLVALASETDGTDIVVLRGPSGAGGMRYLKALAQKTPPAWMLHLAPVPGGLEPLGSLRLALMNSGPLLSTFPPELQALAKGKDLDRNEAVSAMTKALVASKTRAWILIDPTMGVDPATLSTVISSAHAAKAMIVLRVPVDARLPEKTLGAHISLLLPSLRLPDAKEIAATILGGGEEEVFTRVAILGGDTLLGVLEAARAMIVSGDLIHQDGRFVWRTPPRGIPKAIPPEELLDRRLAALPEDALRVLETLAVAPHGTLPQWVAQTCQQDGIDNAALSSAIVHLRHDFLCESDALSPSSRLLRTLVVGNMPPARIAELQRFVASAMTNIGPLSLFAEATTGYLIAEGGNPARGASLLLRAARAAAKAGYPRSAVRLAATAVQFDSSPKTRNLAAQLSREITAEEESAEQHLISKAVIAALMAGDLDLVDRCVETAIADGRDLAAANRVRALTHLARGDASSAMVALHRANAEAGMDPQKQVRGKLTMAWIQIHDGDAANAVRSCLSAISLSRGLSDQRGEAAAIHTMAVCYRQMGKQDVAKTLEEAATSLQ